MTRIVLLDTGPLGLVTHPKASTQSDDCNVWMRSQLMKGTRILVPGITDYELRREMIRTGSTAGIAKLNALREAVGFAPITRVVMDQAATFWAAARNMGKPTASDTALDADMILSGHASVIGEQGHDVVIATTNVKHLNLFCNASLWADIG